MRSLFPYWVYIVQVLLIVHVLKTGRSRYWILMLLFVPLIGGAAYLLVELLPEWSQGIAGQRVRRGLKRTIDPSGALRRLAAAWDRTPNADNARHYAGALLEAGRQDEAEAVLDQALSGLFATDPTLMLLRARLRRETGDPAAAVEVLDAMRRANPDFRSPEAHLMLARALEESGDTGRALQEYRSVAEYYPGVEARYRHALALERAGESQAARVELEQIVRDAELAPAHFRRAQAAWLRRVRAALK